VINVQRVAKDNTENPLGRFRVTTDAGVHSANIVVNCLWESRAMIDERMGLPIWSGTNMRFKFGYRLPFLPSLSNVPSATIVNGPFGDFVKYGREQMYFSWYPLSSRGPVNAARPLPEWDDFASAKVSDAMRTSLWDGHSAQMLKMFPGALPPTLERAQLIGGFIVGNGDTDIIDPASELHNRSDTTIMQSGCYFSLSTQKFTFAPHIARQLLKRFDFDQCDLD
jgi:hypothetical protein